jgi:hypothetical protein
MKGDDPRLEEAHKKALERNKEVNDLKLSVINNHLVVEQFMNDFLDASGETHDNLTFVEKYNLCKKLKPAEINRPKRRVLFEVNELRNKVAHTFDEAEIRTEMSTLRSRYLAALTTEQAKGAKELGDVQIVSGACSLCCSYLLAATNALKARKKT